MNKATEWAFFLVTAYLNFGAARSEESASAIVYDEDLQITL